ncbi:MAG: N-acetylornithine carbamoyltransferase [Candidatus Sulfomarinibacteraceae bacterium]
MTTLSLIGTDEWTDDAVRSVLARAAELKAGAAGRSLAGRNLIMVFLNPSLRTRTSFEVAMARHGGHAVVLEPGRGAWSMETRSGVVMDGDAVEHIVDAARVLGRYGEAVAVRAFPSADTWAEARKDEVVRAFAAHSGVPTINMESARRHPCQGLADALTLQESCGEHPVGRRFVLAWAWHPRPLPTAVPASAAIAAARLGMEVVVARPPGYDLDPDDMAAIEAVAGRNGGTVRLTDDLDAAVAGADAVYAKSWGCLADFGDPEAEAVRRAPYRDWIVNEERMSATRDGAGVFLHCLPVRRNVVVSDGVLDGPWSKVTDQAENRLHAQRAVLEAMMTDGGGN